jgi:hypothetical protein
MNRLRVRVPEGHLEGYLRELERRTIRCGEGEMAARFGFYRTENVRRPPALVFVVAARFPSRQGGGGGPHVGMERDRLLIQADDRLPGIVGAFVHL